jgi:hypothetical protein
MIRRLYLRLTRGLRLRIVQWSIRQSEAEIQRLQSMRRDIPALERNECCAQVKLAVRRQAIEREGA